MENLIFLIIAALVFIFKIREGMKKYNEQRPERDGNASSEPPVIIRRNPPAPPAAPGRPRPTMPPRPVPQTLPQLFDELLGVERPADDERELPTTRAAAARQPAPVPPPVPASGSAVVPAERRRYLDDDDSGSIVASASAAMSLTHADMMAQNMAKAFPAAMRQVRSLRPGVHAPIHVCVGGRSGLRHAVIMAEVLQRPRAYDL
ncbi:hypothetical protein [Oligosphaera ethanolica]|uniref:Uncharacterized protein n=1 Tax=Oligosphaera ethanolica TaxID=760260 RepID=A0AAE3VH21_9BACT|nr:hypothetical protein [Oligosphaera ethanolica]MDQ0290357.1 hypothetical protein [Oligosphaera ethanolica]